MKNNNTQDKNRIPESPKDSKTQSKFRCFETEFNENYDTTTVKFNLPLEIYLHGNRPEKETTDVFAEDVRLNIYTLSNFIKNESYRVIERYSDDRIEVQETCLLFNLLARYIIAYTEIQEMLSRHKNQLEKNER